MVLVRTKAILTLLLSLAACFSPGITDGSLELEKFLDNLVQTEFLPSSKAVGLGISVISPALNYTKGFGHRDLGKNLSVETNTLFNIGSLTKGIVSLLSVKILSETFPKYGEAVLEIPVKRLLAESSANNLNWTLNDRYRSDHVSFRDLLSHRSCLSTDITGAMFGAVTSRAEYNYRIRYEEEICPFRTAFAYNNGMYSLAGAVIAQIGGRPFETLLNEFLSDLGMTDSRLVDLNEDYPAMDQLAQPYYVDEKTGSLTKGNSSLLRGVGVVAPAGALLSTAKDMLKYMQFHLNKGQNTAGRQIIPKDIYEWVRHTGMRVDDTQGYGLGIRVTYIPGEEPLLRHSGSYAPYLSLMHILPHLNVAVFTTTAGPGSETPANAQANIHDKILQHFLESEPKLVSSRVTKVQAAEFDSFFHSGWKKTEKTSSNAEIPVFSRILERPLDTDDLIGSFGHPVNGEMQVSYRNASLKTLKVNFGVWSEADLIPLENQNSTNAVNAAPEYKLDWISDIKMIISAVSDAAVPPLNIVQFPDANTLVWRLDPSWSLVFQRNVSLSTLPEIPWGADTC